MKITKLTLGALFVAALASMSITSCSTDIAPVYELNTSVSPEEAGVISPSEGSFDDGTEITLQATANDGWVFTGWGGDVSSTNNPVNFTITKDSNVIGIFERRTYPLTIEIVGEGSVTERIIQGKTTDYESGTLVELEATPDQGWVFTGWEGDVESNESVVELLIDGNKSVTARFVIDDSCRIVEGTVFITTTSLPGGVVGTEYNERLLATGGSGDYTWEIASGELPQGLALNTASGDISGEPAVEGTSNFTASVSCAGQTATKDLSITIVPPTVTIFRNAVINVDFMASILEMFGDEVYDGDDGILSSADGIIWNPTDSNVSSQIIGAMDEFGEPTFVDMGLTASFGSTFIGAATNELQDNGLWSAGINERAIEWKGLLADSVYDLAVYVYHEDSINKKTTLNVTHAGGTTTLSTTANTTWVLPGERDQDYFLLEEMVPFEISEGVYGFRIDNLSEEGSIVGLQLKGLVPAPEE